jgi:hypothetical protein
MGPGSLATGRGRLWPLAEAPVADWRVRLLGCCGHAPHYPPVEPSASPADRYDCYGALRQVEKLQAQARGATNGPARRRPATHSLTSAGAIFVALAAGRAVGAAQAVPAASISRPASKPAGTYMPLLNITQRRSPHRVGIKDRQIGPPPLSFFGSPVQAVRNGMAGMDCTRLRFGCQQTSCGFAATGRVISSSQRG